MFIRFPTIKRRYWFSILRGFWQYC